MIKSYYLFILSSLFFYYSNAQIINILDSNLKNRLINEHNIDANGDGEIQITEANNYTGIIDVRNFDSSNFDNQISDFTGMVFFKNISAFYGSGNDNHYGNTFDFSNCPNLEILDLSYINYDELIITSSNNIKELNISGYSRSINISSLNDLETLILRHTRFSAIDVSNNLKLKELSIFASKINSLDLSKNTFLEDLSTGGAPLNRLDITNNSNIKRLEIQSSNYEDIDLSKNIKLESIACHGSQILQFDLSKNINLKTFGCGNNKFTELDLSKNINLERFVSQGNDYLKMINLQNGNNENLYFEALRHPVLNKICVDNEVYAKNNFTNIDNSDVFNNCSSLSITPNELNTSKNIQDFNISPMPLIGGVLEIENRNNKNLISYDVISLDGRVIQSQTFESNSFDVVKINILQISSKIFFLRLFGETGNWVYKIIKQ